MELPAQLRCLFSGRLEERDGSYYVEIPKRELESGTLDEDGTYRIAVLSGAQSEGETADRRAGGASGPPEPPVDEGEVRRVEIEDIGDQGDGITRVERGFVVVVPDTAAGERVKIEITDVKQNVAFAEVLERDHRVE